MQRSRPLEFVVHDGALGPSRVSEVADRIPKFAEAGIDLIQIGGGFPDAPPGDPDRLPVEEVAAACQEHGVRIHSVHLSWGDRFDLCQLDPNSRKRAVGLMVMGIEQAHQLGAELVVIHLGAEVEPGQEEAPLLKASELALEEVLPAAQEAGIDVAIENTLPKRGGHRVYIPETHSERIDTTELAPTELAPIGVGSKLEDLAEIVEHVASPHLGICLDTGHLNLAGDVVAGFRSCANKIITFHVHDNDTNHDQHWLPGDGTINWPGLVQAMKDCRWHGSLVLEIGPQGEMTLQEIWDRFLAPFAPLIP